MANYLYNGADLPKVPDGYVHYYIFHPDDGNYYVMCANDVLVAEYSTLGRQYFIRSKEPTENAIYVLNSGEWVLDSENQTRTIGNGVWASHDMYYSGGDLDNTLYLAASEPVPVGGTTPESSSFTTFIMGWFIAPVACLYNGERLPPLPKYDKKKYPYAVIEFANAGMLVRGGRMARLICSSEPIVAVNNIIGSSGYNLTGDVLYFGFATDDFLWEWSFLMDEPYPPINEWALISEDHFDESTFVSEVVTDMDLIWSNHEVTYVGYNWVYPASDPVPIYEPLAEPISYSYNGVPLPSLPEYNREKYTYLLITTWSDGSARLYVSKKPFRYDGKLLFGENAMYISYTYSPNDDFGWYVYEDKLSSDATSVSGDSHVWSNHDILNADGTVYLAASEPVPVSE